MAKSEKDNKTLVHKEITKPSSGHVNKKRIYLSRLKRKVFRHVWVIRALIILGIVGVSFLVILSLGQLLKKTKIPYYYNLANNFIFTPKGVIDEMDGSTNILVLGKGGEGHEAPDLTDTILFLSLDHYENKITMISLPRDIWLPALRAKLNSVYYWGNEKEAPAQKGSGTKMGGGIILAKASVEEILGQHVHYGVVLDFSGFKEIIDILGGVEVDVETSFTDDRFPIPGREEDMCEEDPEFKCRYETVFFEAGKQLMDGETALKFARSRNAEGDEGTDFARQKRQQKIIKALENKVFSKNTLTSPKILLKLKDVVLANLETDIEEKEGTVLARYLLNSKDNISSHILPEELLFNPPISPKYDNLYVFIPKDEDWSEVHSWVECVFERGNGCL
ncbi:LCP family protein [Patescibacteria group bacterium]